MTERTVTALYDTRSEGETARQQLVSTGVPAASITLHAQGNEGTASTQTSSDDGFWASLKDLFIPDEDRYAYAEGLRRGAVLLSARVPETLVDSAVHVLEKTKAVDIETRSAEWQQSGWSGYSRREEGTSTAAASSLQGTVARMPVPPDATAVPSVGTRSQGHGTSQTTAGTRATAMQGGREEAIPIVEEQLRVGKREVERGSVRVRSYVVETPVEEQVRLRDETVVVERRPVERELQPGDMAAFQEKTIEVTETDEEAVVAKTARVKEELVIRKDVTEETETIRDSVRRTEVEVEDTRREGQAAKPSRQPGQA